MSSNNNRRPKCKYFQRLREDMGNSRKILKLKKKKWIDLIKRLTKSKKYKFFNHDLHNISRRVKSLRNSYRSQLLTRQRLKLYYGSLSDNLLKNLSRRAGKRSRIKYAKKKASEILLFSLETRLDSVLYRSYFVSSISSARQLIIHGNVTINSARVTQSNTLLKLGDFIQISEIGKSFVRRSIGKSTFWPLPPVYVEINYKILNIYFIENIRFINLSNCYSFWSNAKSVISSYKN